MIATMTFTGLRLGEVLGLRWKDVDTANHYVHVTGQLGRNRERVPLKTEAANRSVILLPELRKVLLAHKARSPHSQENDYVFPAPDGRGRDHRSTSKGIERAVERGRLGEGVSAHNLRHTFASHMIVGLKEDAVTVAAQLGHTKPSFTQDFYSREFDKVKNDADRRRRYSEGFGKHLDAVNFMSNSALNEPQDETENEPGNVVAIG